MIAEFNDYFTYSVIFLGVCQFMNLKRIFITSMTEIQNFYFDQLLMKCKFLHLFRDI